MPAVCSFLGRASQTFMSTCGMCSSPCVPLGSTCGGATHACGSVAGDRAAMPGPHGDDAAAARYDQLVAEMDGAAIAELLVRLLVRASMDEMACMVMDAIIYLGQEGGAAPVDIAMLLGLDMRGQSGNVTANRGLEAVFQGLVAKLLVVEEGGGENVKKDKRVPVKKKVYRIDYLWAFHHAEERYTAAMKHVATMDDGPTREYACTRCKATFAGAFAVFNLKRDPATSRIYCTECNGAVEERTIQANVDKAQLRRDTAAYLAIFKAILGAKARLYIPKDAERIYSSSEFLSVREYRKYQEQAGLKQFQSSVFQMETSDTNVKDLVTSRCGNVKVTLLPESREQRARREVEGRKRQREESTNVPWLDEIAKLRRQARAAERPVVGGDEDVAEDAAPAPAAQTPQQARALRYLGHTALLGEDKRLRRFDADTYCYYLRRAGGDLPSAAAAQEYVSMSQYIAGRAWDRLPAG